MNKDKRKILVLVEGAKTDVRLIGYLMKIYEIDVKYEIVSYNTNIYTLYNEMFLEGDPDAMDILQILKEREQNQEIKKLFDEKYTDILLIFDFDPHDPQFSEEKIIRMMDYFVESSDMGKLYLNYPMVEAFYHMKSIPDKSFNNCCATISELKAGTYKKRVNHENRDKDYRKFARTREECNIVILQNIAKAWSILNNISCVENTVPNFSEILMAQLKKLNIDKEVFVLCTCVFYIIDYNPKLVID